MNEIETARARVAALEHELASSRELLRSLERERSNASALGPSPANDEDFSAAAVGRVTARSTSAEKLALFRARFIGRDDVYALRWISSRTGKSGWSPAVRGGFSTGAETAADLLSMTDSVIERHLRGTARGESPEFHVGLYPMVEEDRCRLLVCDFDDAEWRLDAAAYAAECTRAGLQVLTEISRSGTGAHVWLFFDRMVPAVTARSAGMRLLRKAMSRRPEMDFSSYDRFFPAQDMLPERSTGRARLGNLIALPLQGDCRRRGTTIFVEPETWQPFADQFAALSDLSPATAEQILGLAAASASDSRLGPSETLESRPRRDSIRAGATAAAGRKLDLRRDAMLHIPTVDLPGLVITELKHMASVANPEFYRRQAQRFSTFGTPRLVTAFEHDEYELRLPRGLVDEAVSLMKEAGFGVKVTTTTASPPQLDVAFAGELRPDQRAAVDALLPHDAGVLVAPPGAGKTVIACALIAERAMPTAILINRAELLHQWRERLKQFLGLDDSQIGQLGAGRRSRRGIVDLVMMQSISHRASDPSVLAEYGQIIVDECHAIAAPAIAAALRNIDVVRWVGLTATPFRADQMDGLILMQCGPVRHVIDLADRSERELIVHETCFATEESGADGPSIQAIYSELAVDADRTASVVQDVVHAVDDGRSCLVLTNRLDHLDALASGIQTSTDATVFRLHGRMSSRDRRAVRDELVATDADGGPFVLVAIDKIAGEGLDLPTLNTLFLAVPVSFKGRVIQQIGRITRGRPRSEMPAVVHDYRDKDVPLLDRMYGRRRRVMAKEGFVSRTSPPR